MVTFSGAFMADSVSAEKSLDDVQAERQEVKSELSKAESKIADVLYEIKDLNEELVKLETVLKENQKQLNNVEKEIDAYEEEIDEINERIEERNEILKNRIAAYQENGGNINFMDVVLGSEDFTQLISRTEAASTIATADKELMEEQQKDMELVEEKVEEQEEVKEDLKEIEHVTTSQVEEVDKKKKTLKNKETDLKEKKASLESEDSSLASLESEIRAEIAAIAEAEESETTSPSTPEVAAETTESEESTSSSSNNNSSNNVSNNSNSNTSNTSTASKPAKKQESKPAPAPANGGSAISAGKSVMGTPYVWGGKNPSGFDCSGFVSWAYGQAGKSIPSNTGALSGTGTKVSYSQAQAGDLVFFTNPNGSAHVGIYLGGGQFLGAQSSTGVAIASMSSGYWKDAFNGNVRRVN